MNQYSPAILNIKRASVDATGHFSGYASTWHETPDRGGDIIVKGAFLNAIRKHEKAGTMPGMLWSHLQEEVVGKWLSMTEDDHGLLVTGKLTLETERGKGAYALLKDDAIYLSIGFVIAPGGATTTGGIRRIHEIDWLGEVSLVALPMNVHAQIIPKQARPETRRQYEHILRESAGLSAREAKRAAAGGWGALVRNEQDSDLDRIYDATQEILNKMRTR